MLTLLVVMSAGATTVSAGPTESAEVNVEWYSDYEFNITSDHEIVYVAIEFCIDATVGYKLDGLNSFVYHDEKVIVAVTVRVEPTLEVERRIANTDAICPPQDEGEPEPTPTESASPSPSPTESEEPTPSPTESESPSPSPTESESPSPSPTQTDDPGPSPTPTETGDPSPSPTESASPSPSPTDDPGPSPTPTEDPDDGCGQDVTARTDSSDIVVEWEDTYEGVDNYTVWRSEEGGEYQAIVTVNNTTFSYRDHDVEHGVTYEYTVTASIDGNETTPCDSAEITAVPILGTLFAGGMATLLGVAAYSLSRRRKQ